LIYFETFKKLADSVDRQFEKFEGRKNMDMSCIPGKIIGH